jgi:hypothetical protein
MPGLGLHRRHLHTPNPNPTGLRHEAQWCRAWASAPLGLEHHAPSFAAEPQRGSVTGPWPTIPSPPPSPSDGTALRSGITVRGGSETWAALDSWVGRRNGELTVDGGRKRVTELHLRASSKSSDKPRRRYFSQRLLTTLRSASAFRRSSSTTSALDLKPPA